MRLRSVQQLLMALASVLVCPSLVLAQHKTRAEEIQAIRQKKQAEAQPEENPRAERILLAVRDKKLIERFATGYHGLTLVLGGLATGQGFALGPQWRNPGLFGGRLEARTSARFAFSNAYLLDGEIAFPRLLGERTRLEFYALHRNYPRLDYYGPGPGSRKSARTHYRLEDTVVESRLWFRPGRRLQLGISGGVLRVNTGPGNDFPNVSRTETVFSPQLAPGIDQQTNFAKVAVALQFDTRDNPLGPRSGSNLLARLASFTDIRLDQHDFRQLHLEAQHYVPFFNRRRVIALRGCAITTLPSGTSTVPFYLQPTLGGPDDLRGYRAYRFHGNHQLLMNIEYRWESFSGLEMALFADAGKVTQRRSQLDLSNLESSVGFGFRFNVRNATFIRVDTGFSHEGFQVWLKFSNPF